MRDWLRDHWSEDLTLGEWWALLGGSGWGYPMFPADLFGKGLSPELAAVVDLELDAVGAPSMPGGVGPAMAAPVIFQWGTDEQKRRLVEPIAGARSSGASSSANPARAPT